jgi:hypothetical protein
MTARPRPDPSRRRRRLLPLAAAAWVLAPVVAGCSDDAGSVPTVDPDTAVVEYRFTDSSVPPEYHRSYTLTVTDGEARIVVDSYGDVLHDETEDVDAATWTELLDHVERVDGLGDEPDDDCDGGTSHELRVTDGEHSESDPAVGAHVGVCGGSGRSDADQLEQAVQPALDLFDMDVLLAPSD